MRIAVGTVVAKYQLEQPLARGGMGSVWVARHVKLGTPLAVKFLDPRFAAAPAFIERFEREARAAATLQSPHVVHVQDYGVEEDTPYLVMELLRGEDLSARLNRVGRLSLPETSRVLVQIGKALRKAHEAGIVHRDLKPANLFLTRIDDDEVVKVLDFGIAKETQGAVGEATKTGETMGSPHYMSPEQARADKGIDHRADLWSLGVILYRMVTGVLPFPGDVIGAVLSRILVEPVPRVADSAPDLPAAELDAFFAKAMAKTKEQRFQSIRDLADAFVRIGGGVPLTTTGHALLATSMGGLPIVEPPEQATVPLPAPNAPAAVPAANAPGTLTTTNMVRDPETRSRRGAVPWVLAVALLIVTGAAVFGWSRLGPNHEVGTGAPAAGSERPTGARDSPPAMPSNAPTTAAGSSNETADPGATNPSGKGAVDQPATSAAASGAPAAPTGPGPSVPTAVATATPSPLPTATAAPSTTATARSSGSARVPPRPPPTSTNSSSGWGF